MATNISSWRNGINRTLTACPNGLIDAAVLIAMRDFFTETLLWREALDAADVVASTATYSISSSNGDIVSVDFVEFNGERIDPTSEDEMDFNERGWRDQTNTTPTRYIAFKDDTIRLVYTPDTDDTEALEVYVNIMPTQSATTVPDWVWTKHEICIRYGALAELYSYANQPWGNIDKAEYFRARYNECRAEAKRRKTVNYTEMQDYIVFGCE